MKLAVIGAGKMARAIVAGLLAKNIFQPSDIVGTARSKESQSAFLALDSNLHWTFSLQEACENVSLTLLAVKPFQFEQILPEVKKFSAQPLFISVAAGIPLARMATWLGNDARIVRCMPNTPVLVGLGVTAFAQNDQVTTQDTELVQKMFSAVGDCYAVPEEQIDIVTALSGSGPAYFYQFVEHLQHAASQLGLDSDVALKMAIQTARGAAEMLRQTKMSPAQLIDQVKSKGGTTEAALNTFAQLNFGDTCKSAVNAAFHRAGELSNISSAK